MAMTWVWVCMAVASVLCAAITGRTDALSVAVVEGATNAVTLCVSMAGVLCLWTGVMEVARQAGLLPKLARLLRPVLGRLFPAAANEPEALGAVSANVSANLLGLGNAATPLGLEAARRLHKLGGGDAATPELCTLVVMNTASIQLIPATVAGLRASNGCATPFDILPAVWITSVCSVAAGLLAVKLCARRDRLARPKSPARGRGHA